VGRPEKISEITMLLNPGFMEGNVILVGEDLFIITRIKHNIGVHSTSTIEVVEPGWGWKMRYKFKRFMRRIGRTIARTWRRFRADRNDD
jgi:hypothetical protein